MQCVLWKRYSDFHHLSKQLEVIHQRSRLDTVFPSIIKAKYFGKRDKNISTYGVHEIRGII